MWTESEIQEIASNAAEDFSDDGGMAADHEDRITELERENNDLRSEVDSQALMIDELQSEARSLSGEYYSHTH